MPTINPAQIPLVNPGSLFYTLTNNNSLAIRFLTSLDPHYYDVYNRPLADIGLRQLIIAKTIDQINLRLSHQSLFPFLIPTTVDVASTTISLPPAWLWDCHISLSSKYTSLRLAQIERISGTNDPSAGSFTGQFLLIFTATLNNGAVETGIFTAVYDLNSSLSFQIVAIQPCAESQFSPALPTNEDGTIAGYIIFRTLQTTEGSLDAAFLTALAPPIGSGSLSTGSYATPTIYQITDSPVSSSNSDSFQLAAMSHGTGLLVSSAFCALPPVQTDEDAILSALDYPWRSGTSLLSLDKQTTVPNSLFSIFEMNAPMGDRATSDANPYPVYLTGIQLLDPAANSVELFFSTMSTIVGSTSRTLIQFASLVLSQSNFGSGGPGTQIRIYPVNNLINNVDPATALFQQNFGVGFVELSDSWANDSAITSFFASLTTISDLTTQRAFIAELGEFALHRSPSTVPTIGQAQALVSSTARRANPIAPSDSNRFVGEQDIGLGDPINFPQNGFPSNRDIDDNGYTGSLLCKTFQLKVNSANDANFTYATDILPRIVLLLGRQPVFGDVWYDGTVFKRFNGDTWIG